MSSISIDHTESPPSRAAARLRPRALIAPGLAAAGLFVLALLPRLVGIGLFVTPDEDNWMRRAGNFALAIEQNQLERTYVTGHPGVITMWVARLGLGSDVVDLARTSGSEELVTRLPGFMELLVRARLSFAGVSSALVVGIALLLWRLLGAGPAVLGGVLMALDPFLIAHSQVVHVDALSTHLITIAVLAGALFWWGGGGRGYLALCAVASGLAILSKAPSLFLAAFLPLMAVGGHLTGRTGMTWRGFLISLVACGLGTLATIFLFWPALWVAPVDTVRRAIEHTLAEAGTPHGPGNYFLGRPTPDPGPFFYPVAILFRLSPMVGVGLAALAILLAPARLRWQVLLLVDFLIGFLLFLAVASKKLDRYALPLFPILAALAGLGLWLFWLQAAAQLGRLVRGVSASGGAARPSRVAALVGGLALIQSLPLLAVLPYPLAYYNPLVGGGPAARQALLVGWGEGLDQVASYLNAQPNAASSRIAIYYPLRLNFQGMVSGTVQSFGGQAPADYVVDYVNAAQRRQTPSEVLGLQPELTVQINGIVYARVYRLSPPRPIRSPSARVDDAT